MFFLALCVSAQRLCVSDSQNTGALLGDCAVIKSSQLQAAIDALTDDRIELAVFGTTEDNRISADFSKFAGTQISISAPSKIEYVAATFPQSVASVSLKLSNVDVVTDSPALNFMALDKENSRLSSTEKSLLEDALKASNASKSNLNPEVAFYLFVSILGAVAVASIILCIVGAVCLKEEEEIDYSTTESESGSKKENEKKNKEKQEKKEAKEKAKQEKKEAKEKAKQEKKEAKEKAKQEKEAQPQPESGNSGSEPANQVTPAPENP